jgi:hypothetical protein
MGERNVGHARGKRTAKGARRVSVDDHQVRRTLEQDREECLADEPDMRIRIVAAPAVELKTAVMVEAVFGRIKPWMLAREDQGRREPADVECSGDRRKLDRLGTGPDDERDTIEQLSP